MKDEQQQKGSLVIPMGRWKVSMGDIDKSWFQEQLRRRDLTQAAMAAQMSIEPAVLSYVLNGTRELKVSQAVAMANILGVPVDEVMRRWGFNVPHEVKTVPVKYVARDDLSTAKLPAPFLQAPVPPGFAADGFAVRMQPTHGVGGFWDGMVCYVEPGHHEPRDCAGRLALIETEDKTCLFGVLSRPDDRGEFSLVHPGLKTTVEHVLVAKANPAFWHRSG